MKIEKVRLVIDNPGCIIYPDYRYMSEEQYKKELPNLLESTFAVANIVYIEAEGESKPEEYKLDMPELCYHAVDVGSGSVYLIPVLMVESKLARFLPPLKERIVHEI